MQSKVPFWKGKKYQMYVTPMVKESIEEAVNISTKLNEHETTSVHIFWSVINSVVNRKQNESQFKMYQLVNNNGISPEKILEAINDIKHQSEMGARNEIET